MNILIVTEDLVVGGAQIFALRLAQALSKDNNVHLFCYLENLIINDIVRTISPDIKLLTYRPRGAAIPHRALNRGVFHQPADAGRGAPVALCRHHPGTPAPAP